MLKGHTLVLQAPSPYRMNTCSNMIRSVINNMQGMFFSSPPGLHEFEHGLLKLRPRAKKRCFNTCSGFPSTWSPHGQRPRPFISNAFRQRHVEVCVNYYIIHAFASTTHTHTHTLVANFCPF